MKVAIVGATGAVGKEFLRLLEEENLPIEEIRLFASSRSKGKKIPFQEKEISVEEITPGAFKGIDIAFFSAGSSISKKFAPQALKEGVKYVIDNSSAFRMEEKIPLIIPEINIEDLEEYSQGIIANPNCSTILLLMGVYPILRKYPIEKIIVSTYQAASGAGLSAMKELLSATQAYLEGKPFTPEVLPVDYAFNLFPHNSPIDSTGYNQEERKMIHESEKILKKKIPIYPTCVRVPVLRAHTESIHIELKEAPSSLEELISLWEEFPGVEIVDTPTPRMAEGRKECFIGHIRLGYFSSYVVELLLVGDQLLKGAAWNALQIAKYLLKNF